MFSVVIVEDRPDIASLLEHCVRNNRWLTPAGIAATKQQAIAMIRTVRPDLVLLDFSLPDSATDGFEVWRQLLDLDLDPEPDVIAVTNASDTRTVEKARKRGAFSYVVKPFRPAVIDDKLADFAVFRRLMEHLSGPLTQEEIERVFDPPHRSSPPPAGLDRTTLSLVVKTLVTASGSLEARDVADRLAVSRETANRYLLYLHDQRIVDRVADSQGPGRPRYRYTLVAAWRAS